MKVKQICYFETGEETWSCSGITCLFATSRSPKVCLAARRGARARSWRRCGAKSTHGLEDEVQVTACGSLGLCEHGPNLVVYPEGIWYSGVTPADVPEIVRSHFQEDTPVERLAGPDPADLRAEIRNNRE